LYLRWTKRPATSGRADKFAESDDLGKTTSQERSRWWWRTCRMKPWMMCLAVISIVGCTRSCGKTRGDMTPDQVVEAYLDIALNMSDVSERNVLMEYTTGNLKSAIEAASEETIRKAYIDRSYKIASYSVVERRDRTPRETEITFRLEYLDLGTGDGAKETEAPKVTTENTVSVIKEDGIWLIRDVMGNKTSIDFPVSEESQITAVPGQMTPYEEPEDMPVE